MFISKLAMSRRTLLRGIGTPRPAFTRQHGAGVHAPPRPPLSLDAIQRGYVPWVW